MSNDHVMESFLAGFSAGREHERKRGEGLVTALKQVFGSKVYRNHDGTFWMPADSIDVALKALSAYEKDGEA